MRDVYVIGVGMTDFGKFPDRNMKSLGAEAVNAALKHAGLEKKDIQMATVGNAYQGLVTGQESIRGQVVLRAMGIGGIPVTNVENACASSSSAFQTAWADIALGLHDVGLVLGMEKMYTEDREKRLSLFSASADIEVMQQFMAAIKMQKQQAAEKAAKEGKKKEEGGKKKKVQGSAFMEIYALGAKAHLQAHGISQRQLAIISAKNHDHAVHNPHAQYRKSMTADEILAAPEVSWPLTAPMCSPVGDGAAAVIICSGDYLNKISAVKPVKILATVLGGGMDRAMTDPDLGERLAKVAYDTAGVGPGDINVAEVHDATAFGELKATEALGFCDIGSGGEFAEQGHSSLTGKLPVNPSGGLECKGHPVGATGTAQIAELVWQLRGEAGKRQVQNARIGLAQNGGGNIGPEEATMVITILQAT